MVKKSKPKKRRVEKIGVPLLKGGEGKSQEIRFRGKEYTLFRQAFYEDAVRIGRDLKADGYGVRFTKGTFDGTVLNIYVRPTLPYIPGHTYTFGRRKLPHRPIKFGRKTPRITPKVGKLK